MEIKRIKLSNEIQISKRLRNGDLFTKRYIGYWEEAAKAKFIEQYEAFEKLLEKDVCEKYHVTVPYENIEFDEHSRPFYRDNGLIMLSRKNEYHYTIKN